MTPRDRRPATHEDRLGRARELLQEAETLQRPPYSDAGAQVLERLTAAQREMLEEMEARR